MNSKNNKECLAKYNSSLFFYNIPIISNFGNKYLFCQYAHYQQTNVVFLI